MLRKMDFIWINLRINFLKKIANSRKPRIKYYTNLYIAPTTSNKLYVPGSIRLYDFSINRVRRLSKSFVQQLRNAGSVSFYFVWIGCFLFQRQNDAFGQCTVQYSTFQRQSQTTLSSKLCTVWVYRVYDKRRRIIRFLLLNKADFNIWPLCTCGESYHSMA